MHIQTNLLATPVTPWTDQRTIKRKKQPTKKKHKQHSTIVDPTTTMAEPAAKKATDKVGELFDVSLMSMEYLSIGFVWSRVRDPKSLRWDYFISPYLFSELLHRTSKMMLLTISQNRAMATFASMVTCVFPKMLKPLLRSTTKNKTSFNTQNHSRVG